MKSNKPGPATEPSEAFDGGFEGSFGLEEFTNEEEFYGLLNIDTNATEDEIKASYRRLCLLYHPDKHKGSGSSNDDETQRDPRLVAEYTFQRIQEAYNVLSDPNKRYIYDKYGIKGLETAWDLGFPLTQADDIKAILEETEQRKNRELEDRDWSTKTTIAAAMDGSDCLALQAPPSLDALIVSQLVEKWVAALSSHAILYCRCESKLRPDSSSTSINHSSSNALMMTTLRRGFGDHRSGSLSLCFGSSQFGRASFETALSPLTGLELGSTVYFHEGKALLSSFIAIQRVLGPGLWGSMNITTGLQSSLLLTLRHERQRLYIMPKFMISPYNLSAHLTASYDMMEDRMIRLKATFGLRLIEGLAASFALQRAVTTLTRAIATLEFNPEHHGIVLKLGIARKGLKFALPIILWHEGSVQRFGLTSLMYSALLYLAEAWVLGPLQQYEEGRVIETFEMTRREAWRKKKQAALEAIHLMKDTVSKKTEIEIRTDGLVIREATYGDLGRGLYIDVRIPLQALVVDSQLRLCSQSKVHLIGFYDPCLGRDKQLSILYEFRGKSHRVVIDDKDSLILPRKEHLIL